jgi:hypothetical protein
MDETLTRVAVDVSGRPFLVFRTEFKAQKIGTSTPSWCANSSRPSRSMRGMTLHVETLYGDNAHHIAESCFKGWRGRCGRRCRSIRARATASPRPRARFVEVLDGILHGHDAAARKATGARKSNGAAAPWSASPRRRSCSRASGCSASGSGSRRCCSCSFWAC